MKTEETSDCIGIASPLNNGFVEGINNRTKMIKRVMYGRCEVELLAGKNAERRKFKTTKEPLREAALCCLW